MRKSWHVQVTNPRPPAYSTGMFFSTHYTTSHDMGVATPQLLNPVGRQHVTSSLEASPIVDSRYKPIVFESLLEEMKKFIEDKKKLSNVTIDK